MTYSTPMKNSLKKLPQRKRGELDRIVSVIREMAPKTEMIILFGSYARGSAVEDVTVDGNTTYEYSSDFDILVIVKSRSLADQMDLWYDIEDKAGRLPVETPITLIAHDIKYINRQLDKGQYFFSDIKKEGIVLYDSENYQLSEAKTLTPVQRLILAKADFKEYFESGQDFMDIFEYTFSKEKYKKAAFMLYQAVETFYKTVLLVHMHYNPKTHDLDKLFKMAGKHDKALLKIFPLNTEQEKHCFDLLKRAYVEARYDLDYVITAEELRYIASCAEKLMNHTKTSCEKKMASFM
jgi:uncharacterized protein